MKPRSRLVIASCFGLVALLPEGPRFFASSFSPSVGRATRSVLSITELSRANQKKHAVSLHLFFQSPQEVDEVKTTSTKRSSRRGVYNPDTYDGLSTGRIKLPYRCITDVPTRLLQTTTAWTQTTTNSKSSSAATATATLTIRLMQPQDIPAITQMCVDEYGSLEHGDNHDNNDFSFLQVPAAIGKWLDRQVLRNLVATTMQMKVVTSELESVNDHAVIVASVCDKSLHTNKREHIVGMIEVSQQPVLPDRNPPPYPIPLFMKRAYCRIIAKSPLQAWIANLLVVPAARGMGLSKLLVAAAEGVAMAEWNCNSIHLHCDADGTRGKIPQQLYKSLGYEPPPPAAASQMDPQVDLSWMTAMSTTMNEGSDVALSNSIYFIDGVPLLYLQKDLKSSNEQ